MSKKVRGFTLDRIFSYFLIYSIIGFFIETLFCFITTGVLESRKSFLYGPFCGVYGFGATVLIMMLYKYRKRKSKVFLLGLVLGSITEYIISLVGEIIFGIRWWDYYSRPLNINGRICLYYSLFWAVLSVIIICFVNPKLDKLLFFIKKKVGKKLFKKIIYIITTLVIIDILLTGVAVESFSIRTIVNKNIDIENLEDNKVQYEKIYSNKTLKKIIDTFFSDEKVLKAFPNLRIQDRNGNIIYLNSLYPEIKTYIYKKE